MNRPHQHLCNSQLSSPENFVSRCSLGHEREGIEMEEQADTVAEQVAERETEAQLLRTSLKQDHAKDA